MVDNDDEQGFTSYVAAMLPQLQRQAYHLCGDWYEAEDLTQDALIQVYRRWPVPVSARRVGGLYVHRGAARLPDDTTSAALGARKCCSPIRRNQPPMPTATRPTRA